jgi:hypothetical protein
MSPLDCSKAPNPATPSAKLVVTVPPVPKVVSRLPAWAWAELTPNAKQIANSPAIVWNVCIFIAYSFFIFGFGSLRRIQPPVTVDNSQLKRSFPFVSLPSLHQFAAPVVRRLASAALRPLLSLVHRTLGRKH